MTPEKTISITQSIGLSTVVSVQYIIIYTSLIWLGLNRIYIVFLDLEEIYFP